MELSQIFTMEFIILCLAVAALTHLAKAILSPIKEHRLVQTVVLPSVAIVIGGVAGYFFSTVILGLVAGLLSSLVYSKVRAFIKSK